MTYEPNSHKHQVMKDLLIELGVPDPERDYFYSRGSTVTEAAISAALERVREYKKQVRETAQSLIDLNNK